MKIQIKIVTATTIIFLILSIGFLIPELINKKPNPHLADIFAIIFFVCIALFRVSLVILVVLISLSLSEKLKKYADEKNHFKESSPIDLKVEKATDQYIKIKEANIKRKLNKKERIEAVQELCEKNDNKSLKQYYY